LVDQKVPLEFVGDVFEVMTQVNRHLTKVNTVDWVTRVNYPSRKPGASHQDVLFVLFDVYAR
jgi:protein gp37